MARNEATTRSLSAVGACVAITGSVATSRPAQSAARGSPPNLLARPTAARMHTRSAEICTSPTKRWLPDTSIVKSWPISAFGGLTLRRVSTALPM